MVRSCGRGKYIFLLPFTLLQFSLNSGKEAFSNPLDQSTRTLSFKGIYFPTDLLKKWVEHVNIYETSWRDCISLFRWTKVLIQFPKFRKLKFLLLLVMGKTEAKILVRYVNLLRDKWRFLVWYVKIFKSPIHFHSFSEATPVLTQWRTNIKTLRFWRVVFPAHYTK